MKLKKKKKEKKMIDGQSNLNELANLKIFHTVTLWFTTKQLTQKVN